MFEVSNLRFRYPKSETFAVDGIDFQIREGEIFGFLGPSGAGKSTTQKLLIKLQKSFEGNILYRGRSLQDYDDEYFQDIGVCFEMPISFSKLTAMENLDFFRRLYRQTVDVEPLLKRVGLWEHRHKKAGEYSKGMKIRLNFVRALLNNPKILFLDEPTNGIDPVNSMIMKDMIREFREQGGTVFLASHIMSDVEQLCDRVAFMIDGRLGEEDSPRNLKLKYGKRQVTVEYQEDGQLKSEQFTMEDIKTIRFHEFLKTRDIETIHSGESTLEDIFIEVTGGSLHE